MPVSNSERIVDKSRVKLAAEIFTRPERERRKKRVAADFHSTSFETFIDSAQKKWQPSAVQFSGNDLEARKSFQNTGQDQRCKGFLDFMRIDGKGDGSFLSVGIQSTHCQPANSCRLSGIASSWAAAQNES